MFSGIRQRFKDMGTIKALCSAAEAAANAVGQPQPGAEHFVLAALALPDGSARRVFERLGVDPQRFGAAIEQQHRAALASVGMSAPEPDEHDAVQPVQGLYRAQSSGQALMQRLAAQAKPANVPLSGAHVLLAATGSTHGVTPRALRAMGVDCERLAGAARAEIQSSVSALR